MIYGIGTDITKVNRFEKWVKNPEILKRFFHELEIVEKKNVNAACEHYASRFAVKEAFSKALGTGFTGFDLKEICVTKNDEGKPFVSLSGKAADLFLERCGKAAIHLSISHEKEYAIAYVIIEKL